MANPVKTFVNDTSPNLTFTVTRTDGSIVDLTDCTVKFRIQDPTTNTRTNDTNNVCTITDAVHGVCEYAWVGTDLPDAGTYTANLQITYPTLDPDDDNQVETFAVTIQTTGIV